MPKLSREAVIEECAKALCKASDCEWDEIGDEAEWSDVYEPGKNHFRADAKLVLETADSLEK